MRERIPMRKLKEIIRLSQTQQLSQRQIARRAKVSRGAVASYQEALQQSGLDYEALKDLPDEQVYNLLFGEKQAKKNSYRYQEIDFEYYRKELGKKHVTRGLLWDEYRESNPDGLSKTQFYHWFKVYLKQLDPCMRQVHKAGEKCFVDYGEGPEYVDEFGVVHKTALFVMCWGASHYIYAEVSETMGLRDWIDSHVRAFEFFGCVPRVLVIDNLKSGVTKADYYEPELNKTYNDLATHYSVIVDPARVRKPQDKSKVETAVKIAQNKIVASLRNKVYSNLRDINEDVAAQAQRVNQAPFQKLDSTRKELFEKQDKPAAISLPAKPYQFAVWKKAKVHKDYHIQAEKNYFSVPYSYISKTVDVRITERCVEIFHKGERIASHVKNHTQSQGEFHTDKSHMPKSHQKYKDRTPDYLINKGYQIGQSVGDIIKEVLGRRMIIEQSFRSCLGILSLAKKYSPERLNNACKRGLFYSALNYKEIRNILDKNLDQIPLCPMEPNSKKSDPPMTGHENLRDESYYANYLSREGQL